MFGLCTFCVFGSMCLLCVWVYVPFVCLGLYSMYLLCAWVYTLCTFSVFGSILYVPFMCLGLCIFCVFGSMYLLCLGLCTFYVVVFSLFFSFRFSPLSFIRLGLCTFYVWLYDLLYVWVYIPSVCLGPCTFRVLGSMYFLCVWVYAHGHSTGSSGQLTLAPGEREDV